MKKESMEFQLITDSSMKKSIGTDLLFLGPLTEIQKHW